MKLPFDETELAERIERSYRRLSEGDYYQFENAFSAPDYDWPGDKEGREILAFVSHYKMSGRKIPCLEKMLAAWSGKTNGDGYFGPLAGPVIFEQQLSGHSWVLRGLCEHYEQFGDDFSLAALKRVTEGLFLPTRGRYADYPTVRGDGEGGVSGHSTGEERGWLLSSDTGCAFMSIDGLSHVFKITRDERVKELLDEMIPVFLGIDKKKIEAQTHCTLTAARGLMRLYEITGDANYLSGAEGICDLYVNGGGMTATYQNLNWWGRPDSWTEPCAIIDSMMLSGMLYEMTGKEKYRRLAARIWCNGFASAQRANGGAGADFIVLPKGQGGSDTLRMHGFEAEFCCSMRLAEGLWYASTHKDLLAPERDGRVTKRENGTYADGDVLYAELIGDAGRAYLTETVTVDGHTLSPLLKYYRVPAEEETRIAQRVIFD